MDIVVQHAFVAERFFQVELFELFQVRGQVFDLFVAAGRGFGRANRNHQAAQGHGDLEVGAADHFDNVSLVFRCRDCGRAPVCHR